MTDGPDRGASSERSTCIYCLENKPISQFSCVTETGASLGTCGVRHCAGTTSRRGRAFRTMTLPGTPREARLIPAFSVTKEAAARPNSVVAAAPLNHSSDRAVRATLGRQGRPRRPVLRVGRSRLTPPPGTHPMGRHGSGAWHRGGARHRVHSIAKPWELERSARAPAAVTPSRTTASGTTARRHTWAPNC